MKFPDLDISDKFKIMQYKYENVGRLRRKIPSIYKVEIYIIYNIYYLLFIKYKYLLYKVKQSMSKEKTGLFSSTELDSAVLREGFALSDK